MNFIFISPNFPPRYFKWVEALKDHGITVLGLAIPRITMSSALKGGS
jgi:cytochrome b561